MLHIFLLGLSLYFDIFIKGQWTDKNKIFAGVDEELCVTNGSYKLGCSSYINRVSCER